MPPYSLSWPETARRRFKHSPAWLQQRTGARGARDFTACLKHFRMVSVATVLVIVRRDVLSVFTSDAADRCVDFRETGRPGFGPEKRRASRSRRILLEPTAAYMRKTARRAGGGSHG